MRVNCAHDTPWAWHAMLKNLREAAVSVTAGETSEYFSARAIDCRP